MASESISVCVCVWESVCVRECVCVWVCVQWRQWCPNRTTLHLKLSSLSLSLAGFNSWWLYTHTHTHRFWSSSLTQVRGRVLVSSEVDHIVLVDGLWQVSPLTHSVQQLPRCQLVSPLVYPRANGARDIDRECVWRRERERERESFALLQRCLSALTCSRTAAGHTGLRIWTGSGSPGRWSSRRSSRLGSACRGRTPSPGGPCPEGGSRWARTSWPKRRERQHVTSSHLCQNFPMMHCWAQQKVWHFEIWEEARKSQLTELTANGANS